MASDFTGGSVRRGSWTRRRKLVAGLVLALLALLLMEGALQGARVIGLLGDLRISPLPRPRALKVVCGQAPGLRLCPDRDGKYERVRPVKFSPRPAGRRRIITIGESFVHGLSLPMAQAWPARLGHHLGDGVEVLNFGRCGSHAGILHPIVEAAVKLAPDLVVLSVGNNEHSMTTFFTGWAGRHPKLTHDLLQGLSPFQLPGLLDRLLGRPLQVTEEWDVSQRRFEDPTDQRIYAARRRPPDLSWFSGGLASPAVTAALDREKQLKELVYARHLRAMIRACKEAGVPVLLTTLPIHLLWAPVLSGCRAEDDASCRGVVELLDRARQAENRERGDAIIKAMDLDPGVAAVHYEAGKFMLGRGEKSRAAQALRKASGLDLIPDNTPAINAAIRQLAREEEVALADLDRLSEQVLDDPYRVFIDRVHLTAAGSDLVGREVAAVAKKVLASGGAR